ncbi:cytochrome P450 [Jatrophihabitans sp.]|uniref:cytochrome P450 n=1 Tax=Jatrophihabitans sp. TaxID=1932789 RepID=UPI0030C7523F|nr:cytochrome [Jatrophihabitans sp.]
MNDPTHCPFAGFDHNLPDHRATAETQWRGLRAEPGLPRSAAHGGFHILSRYEDVTAAALDWETFSSAQGIAIPDLHFNERLVPVEYDPPRLRAFRRIVMRFLTPTAVAQHEAAARDIARSLVDALPRAGRIDFVETFARPFPTGVALTVFGFPNSDADRLDKLINSAIGGRGDEAARAASEELEAYLTAFVTNRREHPVGSDNIIDAIVASSDDDLLSPAEQLSFVKLLLFGGFTTTTFALSSFIAWIAEHPQDRERLVHHPDLMRSAADEIVRYSSPGTYLGRTTMREVELAGTSLAAGSRVVLGYGSANRDPAQFDRPDELILDRSPNPHLGFGMGPHRCIGVHLAKLELTVAAETLLSALPAFRLDPEGEPIHWMSGETQGMTNLPLILGDA